MIGAMAKFLYKEDPKHNPDRLFAVVRPVLGADAEGIKNNIKYYAMKTGAVSAQGLTKEQYEEMVNEATEQTASSTATEEAHQA